MNYKAAIGDVAKMTLFAITIGWMLSCPGHLNLDEYKDSINSHPYKWETPVKRTTQDMSITRPSIQD